MFLSEIVERWDGILFSIYNITARVKYIFDYPRYSSVLKRNLELKNAYLGQRCFILMNGPSLVSHNLSMLQNEIVFCANFFYRSKLTDVVDPNYYCWLDSEIFKNGQSNIIHKDILRRCPNAKLFFNIRGYNEESFRIDNRTYYTYNKHLPNKFGILNDLSGICSGFTNVVLYAINIAIYMGFKKIYILGLDFEPMFIRHFDKNIDICDDILKLWSCKERVCSCHWFYAKAHFEAYALQKFAQKHSCEVINLNRNSYIRAFPFGDYEEIIKSKK